MDSAWLRNTYIYNFLETFQQPKQLGLLKFDFEVIFHIQTDKVNVNAKLVKACLATVSVWN